MSYLSTAYKMLGALSSMTPSGEQGPTSNLVLWLDGNDPLNTGVQPADGTSLALWVDKSPYGNDFENPFAGSQPTFETNTINGLASISFEGANALSGVNASIPVVQYTLFLVVVGNIGTGFQTVFIDGNSVSGFAFNLTYNDDLININYFTPDEPPLLEDGALDVGNPHIYTILWNGTNTLFYIDNVSTPITNDTTVPVIPDGSAGIGFGLGGGSTLDGLIGEILLYNEALGLTDRNAIYTYLSSKWGV